MRLTFLGTGSAMPTGSRMQSGYLLERDGNRLLVDCGSGVLHSLAQTDTGYEGVDTVLLTHHHLDHVSDLDVLMKARWLAGETDLTIAGPPGTSDQARDLLETHDYMQDRLDLTLGIRWRALRTGWVQRRRLRDAPLDAVFRLPAFRRDGPALTLGADSEAFTDLVEFADGSSRTRPRLLVPGRCGRVEPPDADAVGETLREPTPRSDAST